MSEETRGLRSADLYALSSPWISTWFFVIVVCSYIKAYNKAKTMPLAKYPLIFVDIINSTTKQSSLVIGWSLMLLGFLTYEV